jgi:acid stress-induced BolA-like protein IbaG/YrbA
MMTPTLPEPESIARMIREAFPCEAVEVRGDGHHFEARIVSAAFAGLPRIERHRLVYAALGERMRAEIHALSMRTLAPGEEGGKG